MRNVRWSMDEKEFLRLKKAMLSDDEFDSNNCYKGVSIGSLLFEFCIGDRYDGIDLYVNVFEGGVDTGYGYLEDGLPYDCIDVWAEDEMFNFNVDYEEFKRNVIEFVKKDAERYKYIEKLDSDLVPNWNGFEEEKE